MKKFGLFHLASVTLNEISMKIATSKIPFNNAITVKALTFKLNF